MNDSCPSPATSQTSSTSQPSSPLIEPQSSPLRYPVSSPISRPRSPSPTLHDISSDSDSGPPLKKRYTFNEPEVPCASEYWPQRTEEEVPVNYGSFASRSSFEEERNNDLQQDGSFRSVFYINSDSDSNASAMELSDSSEGAESVISNDPQTQSSEDSSTSSDTEDSSENESSDGEPSKNYLFSGCELTVEEAILGLMKLFVKHKLEKSTVSGMLSLLHNILPKDNGLPKTQYLLFKFVGDLCPLPPERVHYYCKICIFYLGVNSKNCPVCKSETENGKFFQLSISHQIKGFFEKHNLAAILDKNSADKAAASPSEGYYSDICDGSEYKRVHIPGQYNITLLGHTDGVSVSESSNASLWPLEFVICELPPSLRFRFIIIAGVWLDSSKPNINCYFKPIIQELREISATGIAWTHPITGEENVTHVVCPFVCADAPVRAQIQNILSHGGKHCCNVCEQKMVKLPEEEPVPGKKKKKRRRVFHFKEEPSKLRTSKRMSLQAKVTLQQRMTVRDGKFEAKTGVRGRSLISKIPKCDRSTVVYPEYMHLLLGIMKCFMSLWFSKETGEYSLKKSQDKINEFLLNVRVPDFVTRIPRSTESFSKWKTNEFRSFLLYFSLVIFSEVMEEKYFQHWMLFVNAIFLLLQDRISQSDVESADTMLRMFLRDFGSLYTPEAFTYNFHNLTHLRLIVERSGPLWSTSAFPFENYSGTLRKCVHGSKNQGAELINTIKLGSGIHVLKARLSAGAGCSGNNLVQLRDRVKSVSLNDTETELLRSAGVEKPLLFYRVLIGNEVFTSSIYTRQKKRNNYTVCYIDSAGFKAYGEIKCYCKEKQDSNKILVLINRFEIEHLRMFSLKQSGMLVKHIIPVKECNDVQLIPLRRILFKVIRVGKFVCLRPNKVEVNL